MSFLSAGVRRRYAEAFQQRYLREGLAEYAEYMRYGRAYCALLPSYRQNFKTAGKPNALDLQKESARWPADCFP